MNGNLIILDTNVVIALFAEDSSVQKNLKKADEIFLSSIVLGELYYGALNSSRIEENIAQIEKFAAESVILGVNASTAVEYGKIKKDLKLKGIPIPENVFG
jgi:tRNA(fMet)-specific endonuclease VapC